MWISRYSAYVQQCKRMPLWWRFSWLQCWERTGKNSMLCSTLTKDMTVIRGLGKSSNSFVTNVTLKHEIWIDLLCIRKPCTQTAAENDLSTFPWFQDVFLPDISLPDISLPDVSLLQTFCYQDISLPDISLPQTFPYFRLFPTKTFHYLRLFPTKSFPYLRLFTTNTFPYQDFFLLKHFLTKEREIIFYCMYRTVLYWYYHIIYTIYILSILTN